MPYIPKSQYSILYTNGKELYNPFNGKEYMGDYIKYKSKYFAGKDILNLRVPLKKVEIEENLIVKNTRNFLYNRLNKKQYNKLKKSIPPVASRPRPTEEDYEKGVWHRYFCQRVNNPDEVLEMNSEGYKKLKSGEYDNLLYRGGEIMWSLTNIQTNNDNVLRLERQYPRIMFFFSDPEEFVK